MCVCVCVCKEVLADLFAEDVVQFVADLLHWIGMSLPPPLCALSLLTRRYWYLNLSPVPVILHVSPKCSCIE